MLASEIQRPDCLNMDWMPKCMDVQLQRLVQMQMHLHDVIAEKRFILSLGARLFMHWGLI